MIETLASGAKMSAETYADFVQRLRHHCNGAGVKWHHTAAALFLVEHQQLDYGYERDYAEGLVVTQDGQSWFSPKEYWNSLDYEERAELNKASQEWCDSKFMHADEDDQWHILGELDDHSVTGWNKRWEYINCHFTREAAEAFIERKKHDYGEMRVMVDSQIYAWEFEAIKGAIIAGLLQYMEPEKKGEVTCEH